MGWSRFQLFFWRAPQSRRRRTYHPENYGSIPGLIVELKKDETRGGSTEQTTLQSLIGKVTNQSVQHGKRRQGTRRITQLIDQLSTDRPMKQTGGTRLRPMMLLEGGLSLMVLAFLISHFMRDLSAFLKL